VDQADVTVAHDDVDVGRRDIDAARLECLAILRMRGRQRARTFQDGRECAERVRAEMEDDDDGRVEIGR
jgi:hypothetical protein